MAITLPALIRTRLTTFAAKTTSFAKSLDFKKIYGTLKLKISKPGVTLQCGNVHFLKKL